MGILDGRVAIVTGAGGAGSGIGRATALRLAEEGARTVVVDILPDSGQETLATIRAQGGEGIFVQADVSYRDAVAAMVKSVLDTYGAIHVLHNNVGVALSKAAHETLEEDWDRILRITLKSVYLCCQAVIPVMLKQGGGSIIQTASVLGLVASPKQAAYCAAKGAVVILTRGMAKDYAAQGIRVNCICPSDVDSPRRRAHESEARRQFLLSRIHMDRYGQPEEMAEAVLWLASDASSYVTGAVLPVDGGLLA